jgi:UDP-glucose 4-epimerase
MEKKSYGNTFELGRGENHSVNEVAKMFEIKPIYSPQKPGEARNTLCKSNKAKEYLGWNPQKNLVYYIMKVKQKQRKYDSSLDG